ncbi:hypothetical protein GQ55_5G414900 [Panicum hallii var. hallii]|uniref:Uncharacterized protein n=2 Tax=Panicum hallii TaxID=206008 RepID=A0A2T7DNY4_9POAL|nr:hypothetical protein GQ55_5G414900 [Panicum hallii var. hallii]PUZ57254.1 hypothetical protein GQ55_5G414900 [Panicum hallii var. hallii]PVH38996.1 hypothetical protein PAHAL_5G413100 [Panicum hallii]
MPRCRSGGAPLHLPVVPSSRKPFLVHRPVIKEQTYRDGMLGSYCDLEREVPFMDLSLQGTGRSRGAHG